MIQSGLCFCWRSKERIFNPWISKNRRNFPGISAHAVMVHPNYQQTKVIFINLLLKTKQNVPFHEKSALQKASKTPKCLNNAPASNIVKSCLRHVYVLQQPIHIISSNLVLMMGEFVII